MPKPNGGAVATRLRKFVRDRVHKEGQFYQRGAARALAKATKRPQSWVSHYVDARPERNADIDTALAICAFYGVSLDDFREGTPEAPRASLRPAQVAALRLAEKVERLPEPFQSREWRQFDRSVSALLDALGLPHRSAERSAEGPQPATRGAKR